MKIKPPRVVGRSREFQDYLDRLDFAERSRIEAGEAAYLNELPHRLAPLEHVLGETMTGAEDRPAGTRRERNVSRMLWGYNRQGWV